VADHALTGVLLVGGASRRFGSPKALARFGGETLAERAWRVLGAVCEQRLAVGKAADSLQLPFPVLDDGSDVRAPIAGVVAGLRAAATDVSLFLPVDCPQVTPELLVALAHQCRDAATTQVGPLPAAYRKTALPVLERHLTAGELALRTALRELDVAELVTDSAQVANVNTPAELEALARDVYR
jgi:molybdopterin-guanine dinucleotide biosynthesis protein A